MPSRYELLHWRLQAAMREHNFPDLEYLGEDPEDGHTYRIGDHVVPLSMITEFDAQEFDEDEDESDTI